MDLLLDELPSTDEKQATTDLIRTREILLERGRCQGSFTYGQRVCLAMAVWMATSDIEQPIHTDSLAGPSERARAVIHRFGLKRWGNVCQFNNTSSDAEVLAKLEEAIG